jgi:hypothetical protein
MRIVVVAEFLAAPDDPVASGVPIVSVAWPLEFTEVFVVISSALLPPTMRVE